MDSVEPSLVPQWLKGGSSASAFSSLANQRGETGDQNSKRGKLLGVEPARSTSRDNGVRSITRPGFTDYPLRNSAPERTPAPDRPWKQQSGYPPVNSHPSTTHTPPSTARPTYTPAKYSPDDRDGPDGPSSARGYPSRPYGSKPGPERERESALLTSRSGDIKDLRPAPRAFGRDSDPRDDTRVSSSGGAGPGAAAPTQKTAFDKDFPSLGNKDYPALKEAPKPPPAAPPLSATVAPYKQDFLSARSSSNWTSKLADAPPIQSALIEPVQPSYPQQAPAAGAPAPAPTAAAAPKAEVKPANSWGASSNGAGAQAGVNMAEALQSLSSSGAASASNAQSDKARLELLAVKQSKQLIPVLSSAASKGKQVGLKGPTKLTLDTGKSVLKPAGGVALRGSNDTASAPTGAVPLANGTLTLNLGTVAKKAFDKPLSVSRAPSANPPPAPPNSATAVPAASPTAAASPAAGSDETRRSGEAPKSDRNNFFDSLRKKSSTDMVNGASPDACNPAAAGDSALIPQDGSMCNGAPQLASQSSESLKFQVSAEEEAFLRSLGWTDGEDGEDEEDGLTEEEIAAFKATAQSRPVVSAKTLPLRVPAINRPIKSLIVAASYGSEMVTDSDSDAE